jgi:zinc protease
VLVDKPERSQSQIAIGHLGPPEAAADPALMVVEAAFGGMFTSRLMQAIRVERGWSYGAECVVAPTRGASWTRIHLAPPVEVTPDAVALTLSMFEDVAARGITDDELVQAKSYLVGSLPFQQATARQRVTRALRHHIYGWTPQQLATLPTQLAAVTADQARDAAARWLRPDDALIAVVATADEMVPRLAALGVCDERSVEVVDYDSY